MHMHWKPRVGFGISPVSVHFWTLRASNGSGLTFHSLKPASPLYTTGQGNQAFVLTHSGHYVLHCSQEGHLHSPTALCKWQVLHTTQYYPTSTSVSTFRALSICLKWIPVCGWSYFRLDIAAWCPQLSHPYVRDCQPHPSDDVHCPHCESLLLKEYPSPPASRSQCYHQT